MQRAWGHKFSSYTHAACICNLRLGDAETGRSLKLTGQPFYLDDELALQVQGKTLSQENKGVETKTAK